MADHAQVGGRRFTAALPEHSLPGEGWRILSALDSETGKILWQERIPGASGRVFASPVAAEGRVYEVTEDGSFCMVHAGREFNALGRVKLEEKCYATRALVGSDRSRAE